MVRLEATSSDKDVLVTAFADERGNSTLVVLNRSTKSYRVSMAWPGAKFSHMEITDPYQPNAIKPGSEKDQFVVEPGAIVTLTSVPLGTYRP